MATKCETTTKRPIDIVLDIETAPVEKDVIERYNAAFANRKKRVIPGLHPCLSRIVVVGIKPIKKNAKPVVFAATPDGSVTEKDILVQTKEFLERAAVGRFVTFNGTAFDLPMMRLRAVACGVEGLGRLLPPSRSARNYDLFQLIRWEMPLSLQELALLAVGDTRELRGHDVAELWKAGRIDEIIQHNIEDLQTIEMLYLRRGDMFGIALP